MHRTLLSFIISISLFAAYSADAQEHTDWALKAVEWERAAFNAEDPAEAAEALVQKAHCYRQCGRFDEAAATLGRISMYLLPPGRRDEVLYEKEYCRYMAGDFSGAAACMEEAGESMEPRRLLLDALVLGECARWDESRARAEALVSLLYEDRDREAALYEVRALYADVPAMKTEGGAVLRSFLPPLGHLYTGHVAEGLVSMALNAAAAGWTVWQCIEGNWITGLLGGGLALNATFMGGMERCIQLTEEYNRDSMRAYNDTLRALLLSHGAAE